MERALPWIAVAIGGLALVVAVLAYMRAPDLTNGTANLKVADIQAANVLGMKMVYVGGEAGWADAAKLMQTYSLSDGTALLGSRPGGGSAFAGSSSTPLNGLFGFNMAGWTSNGSNGTCSPDQVSNGSCTVSSWTINPPPGSSPSGPASANPGPIYWGATGLSPSYTLVGNL